MEKGLYLDLDLDLVQMINFPKDLLENKEDSDHKRTPIPVMLKIKMSKFVVRELKEWFWVTPDPTLVKSEIHELVCHATKPHYQQIRESAHVFPFRSINLPPISTQQGLFA